MTINQIITLFFLLFSFNLSAQNISIDTIKPESLIGHWKFLKIEDQYGKNIEKFEKEAPIGLPGTKKGKIQILAIGPDIIFKQDSTYKKIFPGEKKFDMGKWSLDEGIIEYIQTYQKGSKKFKMLSFAAEAFNKKLTFDENGNIIEHFTDKILEFKNNQMKIQFEEIYWAVYKKLKTAHNIAPSGNGLK